MISIVEDICDLVLWSTLYSLNFCLVPLLNLNAMCKTHIHTQNYSLEKATWSIYFLVKKSKSNSKLDPFQIMRQRADLGSTRELRFARTSS